MRIYRDVVKTRVSFGRHLEMQAEQYQNGTWQATYYELADPFIWGVSAESKEQAIIECDRTLDEQENMIKNIRQSQYPKMDLRPTMDQIVDSHINWLNKQFEQQKKYSY